VEREQGTLPLLLIQSPYLARLLCTRIALRLLLVLLVVYLCVGLLLPIYGIPLPGELFFWASLVFLWSFGWCALILLVNTGKQSSAGNAITLICLWLAITVALPGTVNLMAETLYPVPSRVEMVAAIREAEVEAEKNGKQLLKSYYADHPELASQEGAKAESVSDDGFRQWTVMMQKADEATLPIRERYRLQLDKQQQIMDRTQFLLPAVLFQESLNHLSGTNRLRFVDFEQQVLSFNRVWARYFEERVFRNQRVRRTDIATLPQFHYNAGVHLQSLYTIILQGMWLFLLGGSLFYYALIRIQKMAYHNHC
jgi:ABC-2 type transport system permease protein